MTVVKEYSARSSARRAAKTAGLDPDSVEQTEGGKWRVPSSGGSAQPRCSECGKSMQNSGAELPGERVCDDCAETLDIPLDIPEELRVENRRPLTVEQQARLTKVMENAGVKEGEQRIDPRKPKGMSWEEWYAHTTAVAASKREQSLERISALKTKLPPKAPRLPKPRREDAYQPTDVIRVLAEENPCREGTAAHAVFKKYRDGMTVAEFTKVAARACPGRLRPIDYLIYDSKKGRISIGAAAAPRGSKKKGESKS